MRKKKEELDNPEEVYDRHTQKDDGRCLGCHHSKLHYEELDELDIQLADELYQDYLESLYTSYLDGELNI